MSRPKWIALWYLMGVAHATLLGFSLNNWYRDEMSRAGLLAALASAFFVAIAGVNLLGQSSKLSLEQFRRGVAFAAEIAERKRRESEAFLELSDDQK